MKTARIKEIAYEIVRSRRKTADIVIERDGRVLVRAPQTIPDERIEDMVEAKRYWIYKNLAEWREFVAHLRGEFTSRNQNQCERATGLRAFHLFEER